MSNDRTGENAMPIECVSVREDIPALLYDELAPQRKEELEQHLEICADCREVWQSQRRVAGLLDRWAGIDAPCDVKSLAALTGADARAVRRPMLARVRPLLLGAAAGFLLFALFAGLRGEVSYSDGRLTLSLGRAAAPGQQAGPGISPGELDTRVRQLAGHEFNRRVSPLIEALYDEFEALDVRQERHRLLLARATDIRRAEDLRRYRQAVQLLALSFQQESDEITQTLDDVIRWVASNEVRPPRDGG